tara:strand:+ start:3845 stop:4018 length:174 start_codon:yes stop_codon:yes gene_type:complete
MVDKKIVGIENTGNGPKVLIENGDIMESKDLPLGIIRLNLEYDDIFTFANNNMPIVS